MHYLITGHTGFKGSWLTLWLTSLGHQVSGISLDPLPSSLFETARINELMYKDIRLDIRNAPATKAAINNISPDVVFHMAAQPLVRESYKDPRGTFETNVLGTLNVLEGIANTDSVKAHLVITTDKVYRNVNQIKGYVETDPLGGEDPYSASKAMADILTHSWVSSFGGPPTAVVRAGNVIGGGDISPNRLIPDLIAAYSDGRSPLIRYPKSVRPWQHVLDCLNGYLMIIEALLQGKALGEINIGPDESSFIEVGEVANKIESLLGAKSHWQIDNSFKPHEANLLALNSDKALQAINWKNKLKFDDSLEWTVEWYKALKLNEDSRLITLDQIKKFSRI